MSSSQGGASTGNADVDDELRISVRLSDPDELSALTPITATVIYVSIVLVAVLLILTAMWIVTACCENERARRRSRAYREISAKRHICDPMYGSTACLSTITTSTSIDNESDYHPGSTKSPSLYRGTASRTECSCSGSKLDLPTTLRSERDTAMRCSHCNRCDRKARQPNRSKLMVKRRPTERSNLLRNGSLYHSTPNRHVQRSASQSHAVNHYRQYHLPRCTSTLCMDHCSEKYFPSTQMIPRAKLDSSTTAILQASPGAASAQESMEPNLSLSMSSLGTTRQAENELETSNLPPPPPLSEPVLGLSLDRRPLHLQTELIQT